jgi:TonB family protein
VKTAAVRFWLGLRNKVQSTDWVHSLHLKRVLSFGFLILVLAGAAFYFRGLFMLGRVPEPANDVAALNLKVEKEQNLLYLSWNKESSVVRSARNGILSISDGGVDRTLSLNAAQLQSGTVAYYNRTNNLTIRLRVMADGTEASEWVRLAGVRPISASAGVGRFEVKPSARGWGGTGLGKQARGKGTSQLIQPLAAAAGARSLFPQKDIAMEAISGVTAESADDRGAQGKSSANAQIAPPPGVESNQPDFTVTLLAPEDTGTATPDFEAKANYVEPRPIRSVEPYVFRSMRKLLPPGARVKVKVQIDEQGKVIRAEPVADGSADAFLTNLSLDAARKWRFTPARRDNKKVESEVTLEFRFDRDK